MNYWDTDGLDPGIFEPSFFISLLILLLKAVYHKLWKPKKKKNQIKEGKLTKEIGKRGKISLKNHPNGTK